MKPNRKLASIWMLSFLLAAGGCDTDDKEVSDDATSKQDQIAWDDSTSQDVTEDTSQPTPPYVSDPEAVLVVEDQLWVTNVNADWSDTSQQLEFSTGFVSAFDKITLTPKARLELPLKNPQYLVHCGALVGVVCSGTMETDQEWNFGVAEPGGIVWVSPDTFQVMGVSTVGKDPSEPLLGFPGNAIWSQSKGLLFVGSGIGPYAFAFAPEDPAPLWITELYPPDAGNDLVSVEVMGESLYAASFRTGSLYQLSLEMGERLSEPLDLQNTNEVEGVLDLQTDGLELFALFTLSSRVKRIAPIEREVSDLFTTGATPNHLVLAESHLFVVNSGDNNLTRFHIEDQSVDDGFSVFPVGMNPWAMATDGEFGYVTGYMDQSVVKLSLATGELETSWQEEPQE